MGSQHGWPAGAGPGPHHPAWMAPRRCRPFAARLPARLDSRDARLSAAANTLATPQRARERWRPPQVAPGAFRPDQPVAPDRLAADVRPERGVGQLVDLSSA